MFGSVGFPELIMIFIVVLLVFGPKKLPEFAKLLGKTIREFRAAVDEAKAAIEDELYKEGLTHPLHGIGKDIKDALDIRTAVEKPLQDIGREIQDTLRMNDASDKSAAPGAKNNDEEKSE